MGGLQAVRPVVSDERRYAAALAPDVQRRVELLKGFQLTVSGDPVGVPASAQRLIAYLALQERPLQRSYIAGVLWADASGAQSMGSLRSSLWRLHELGELIINAVGQCLQLSRKVEVDVRETTDSARRAQQTGAVGKSTEFGWIEQLITAGDLLPDWYEEWVVFERERVRQLRLHALDSLCGQLADIGRFELAVQAGLAAVRSEPLRETSHWSLMRAYLLEGNRSEAIRHFREYSRLIREELGLDPAISFDELAKEVTAR